MLSHSYRQQLEQMHKEHPEWGRTDLSPEVIKYMPEGTKSIIGYGCGKGATEDKLRELYPEMIVHKYDPGILEFNITPTLHYDYAICADVMEHVEYGFVDDVLRHLASIAKAVYFKIALQPAVALLPDGRNAHVTVKSATWWKGKLADHGFTSTNAGVIEYWLYGLYT